MIDIAESISLGTLYKCVLMTLFTVKKIKYRLNWSTNEKKKRLEISLSV